MSVGRSWMEALVTEAQRLGASDLHLRCGESPRMRISGAVVCAHAEALWEPELLAVLSSVLPSEALLDARQGREHDASACIAGVRCRLHTFCDRDGIAAVLRLLPAEAHDLDALGLPPSVRSLAELRHGLVLVTGPAGSGKSTTLAALIKRIGDTRDAHIVTIEDPIEVVHRSARSLITQREVPSQGPHTARAVRAALRQDPDVLMVGELRDTEAIQLALTAAETGHLVLSTLHASGAVQSISRLLDACPAGRQDQVRGMLAESLQAVVSQRRVATRSGRVAVVAEVLVGTPAARNLIREAKTHQLLGVLQTSRQQGMCTFEQHRQQLAAEGLQLVEEGCR